jgi:hypothetical protein
MNTATENHRFLNRTAIAIALVLIALFAYATVKETFCSHPEPRYEWKY